MSHSSAVRFFDRATPPHISTLILIAGVSALSMNIFLPSLPDIAGHFDADYRLIQLSVAVYLAVNAFLQLFIGPISDRYGRRRVVLTGMALFILATLGCIFAPTVEVFLAFRMMQATVVVGMVLSRAIVRDMHPPDEAASKISYVTMGMAIAPMVGPVLGGFLGEAFGWEATFWLLVALGVYILFTCWQDLGETALDTSTSFKEQFRQYPGLLASPRFWGYCLTAAFASGAFFAYLGGGPYVGSDVYGLNTGRLGVYLGAPTVGYFIGNWYSGRCSVRYGLNKMILWGTIIVCLGMGGALALFYAGFGSAELFFGAMIVVGLGNGLVMPNANAGLLSVRPHLAGSASGLGGAIMIGGGAALSALAGTMLAPGTGAYPLLWIMFVTSILSLLSILFVIKRTQVVGAEI